MTTLLLALAHTGCFIAIAAALIRPRFRRPVAYGLLGLAAVALIGGVLGSGPRVLDVVATFPSFRDNRVVLADYAIETVTAGSFAFGGVALLFAAGWAAALLWIDRRTWPPGELEPAMGSGVAPFGAPLLLAWSGILLVLAFEKTAAPAGLVQPVAFERAIFPSCIAAAALLAHRLKSVMPTLLWVCLLVSAARWPIAAIGTLVTRTRFGTSLDVHAITDFANPFAQLPVRVAPDSIEQLVWLNWSTNLLVLPGLYMLSTGGIAIAVAMFVMHPKPAAERTHP